MKRNSHGNHIKRRMVILSFDAVGARDLVHLKALPNFRRLMEQGALCEQVESVYPSLTYPAHTSIITGLKPVHHRIVNNTCFQPEREKPDWNSDRRRIQGTTLYDLAIDRGDRVCSILWPVTGGSRIQYNIPEIHATRWYHNTALKTMKDGSFGYICRMLHHAKQMLHGITEPELDDFVQSVLLDTIYSYNPELLMVHFLDVDTNRHLHGLDHPEIMRAYKRLDDKLGEIVYALEHTKAGSCHSMENTTIVVLGDHCQIDCDTVLYPNCYLKEQGLLTVRDGRIADYQAAAKNCDGSCYIYLNPEHYKYDTRCLTPNMTKDLTAMTTKLTELFSAPKCPLYHGISRIFTGIEAAEMGADDRCVIMLEAKPGYYFLDDTDSLTRPVSDVTKHKMIATHGYLPTLPDYQTFLLMSGYGIKKGARAGSFHLWDEAPTFAHILGLKLPDADGRIIRELLKV